MEHEDIVISWASAKERCKLDIRKCAFSERTINQWNRLPGECVNATSVNMLWATSITGHSISHWLPCPVPFWVPNKIGTWGGNSVKFS